MTTILFILWNSIAFAVPIIDETSKSNAERLLYTANYSSPYGRLMIALAALESNSDESTIYSLGSTHPQIAEMLLVEEYKLVLEYISHIPSTEIHKLRKGDSIIRTLDQMGKIEKKFATILAKHLGLPKKINAIRIGSFDNVTINVEVSYKKSGATQKMDIQMAGPNAPYADQQSRHRIGRILGSIPSPPLDGNRSLLPLSSGSFEQGLAKWPSTDGFSFEATQPIGVVGLDSNNSMDGKTSLRFYNTQKTRVFESLHQTVSIPNASEVVLQCFVQTQNAQVEYRQDPSFTYVALRYKDALGTIVKEDKKLIRMGTYSWEALIIESYVPQSASTVDVVLLSSVSGTIWFDGISFIQKN